ncbi:MAG: hypothetical protein U0168_22310 [Nannocystaceae bacterium]
MYDLGPDGRPYAADATQHAQQPRGHDADDTALAPADARAPRQRDDVPAIATPPPSTDAEVPQARARAPDEARGDPATGDDAAVRSDVVRAYRGEPAATAHFDLIV